MKQNKNYIMPTLVRCPMCEKTQSLFSSTPPLGIMPLEDSFPARLIGYTITHGGELKQRFENIYLCEEHYNKVTKQQSKPVTPTTPPPPPKSETKVMTAEDGLDS